MENEKKISCAQAKEIDLVFYLAGLGFEPVKIRGNNYWYYSPFRVERNPSFKVNRILNRWYDFGEGKGGSIIDFAIRYLDCSISEFLLSLEQNSSPFSSIKPPEKSNVTIEPAITVLSDTPVLSRVLCRYLQQRQISIELTDRYLREIRYCNSGKIFYGIGFQNSSGGWEIRSPYFKGSSSPKFYTHFKKGKSAICVFEGFFDFLSFQQLFLGSNHLERFDFLILNSLSFAGIASAVLQCYEDVHLFLDNDSAGSEATILIRSATPHSCDCRSLYNSHKDLNDFLCGSKSRE